MLLETIPTWLHHRLSFNVITIHNTISVDSDWNMLVMECSSLASKWREVSTYLGLIKTKQKLIIPEVWTSAGVVCPLSNEKEIAKFVHPNIKILTSACRYTYICAH